MSAIYSKLLRYPNLFVSRLIRCPSSGLRTSRIKANSIIVKCGLVSLGLKKVATYGICFGIGGCFAAYSINRIYFRAGHVFAQSGEVTNDFIAEVKSENAVENDHSQLDSDTAVSIWTFVLPDLYLLEFAVAFACVAALCHTFIPLELGALVNIIKGMTSDDRTPADCERDVWEYASFVTLHSLKLLLFYAAQAVATFGYISVLHSLGENISSRLRNKLFRTMVDLDMKFYDTHMLGELVNRLTSDVQDFKSSFKACISQGLRSITQIAGSMISLSLISPKLTSLIFIITGVTVVIGTVLGSFLRYLSKQAQHEVEKSAAIAQEALGNILTVKAFGMEDHEVEIYSRQIEVSAQFNKTFGTLIGVFQGLSNLALNSIVLMVVCTGGGMVVSNQITPGHLMSFLVASQMLQRSLGQLSTLLGQSVRGLTAAARICQFLDLQPDIKPHSGEQMEMALVKGAVSFSNVDFRYPSRPKQVLSDFSLDISPGQVIALVGKSGSGKSTIAKLLERFYDVDRGSIAIDGHDVRDLDPTWMRRNVIGFISQEPVLFASTIEENIRYGKPDATHNEVVSAAKLANCHDFITSFPNSYDTTVGERGVALSGGQKQRIAIARALIKDPRIIILDEATSALDSESEAIVQRAIDSATKGRTVLVIAHRLSTVVNANLIAVVDNGSIVESGTHSNLMKSGRFYPQLIHLQQKTGEGIGVL